MMRQQQLPFQTTSGGKKEIAIRALARVDEARTIAKRRVSERRAGSAGELKLIESVANATVRN
ncbi:MAG: hypothetical protein A2749_00415 [Parcubacteria group bacterium RIFCSPHIGHO2_01_FULL_45_26]|nr:MAG: hypothetical protein A2749_00415 [Parcubacteria group bacterium RIFCSPHIGHO2_01_FULL_45_26]